MRRYISLGMAALLVMAGCWVFYREAIFYLSGGAIRNVSIIAALFPVAIGVMWIIAEIRRE